MPRISFIDTHPRKQFWHGSKLSTVKPQQIELRFFVTFAYSKYILDTMNSESRTYLLTILNTICKTHDLCCVRKRNVCFTHTSI